MYLLDGNIIDLMSTGKHGNTFVFWRLNLNNDERVAMWNVNKKPLSAETCKRCVFQLEVHEAKAMLDNHPQWDIPDTEEEDEEQEDSDGIEESEDDDEDNDWMHTHTHTYAQTPPLPHGPAPLTNSWPHNSTQEQTRSSEAVRTHRITRDSLYTQSPPPPPFYHFRWHGLWPRPSISSFLQRLVHSLSGCCRKRILWILTQACVCENGCACECVWYKMSDRTCVCYLVCVCTGVKDWHTVDWRTYYLGSVLLFSRGRGGCITADSVCKINKNHIALAPKFKITRNQCFPHQWYCLLYT